MRYKRVHLLLSSCLTLALCTLASLVVARAGNTSQDLTTSPFIAAESPQTKDFQAVTSHLGRRNPYFFLTNSSQPGDGSYCGVILNHNGRPGFSGFESLSFAYNGARDARTFVIYKPPVGPFMTKYLTLDQGQSGVTGKDGFMEVSFTKAQFGIAPGSFIRDIVIVPPPKKEAGRFRIDDIRVNQEPVKKLLATSFFNGENAPVGGAFSFAAAATPVSSPTSVVVRNSDKNSVEVWFTLGVGGGSAYTAVNQVFPQSGIGDPQWANGGGGSQDHLTLPAQTGSTPSIIRSISTLTNVNGRIYFGTAGSSYDPTTGGGCPTANYPCGANLAEWSLNNPTESCNISCNNGMNAKIQAVFKYNNGFPWNSGTTGVAPHIKLVPISVASTKTPLSANVNNPGVYPFNCPCCSDIVCGDANCGLIYPDTTLCSSSAQSCTLPYQSSTSGVPTSASRRKLCQAQRTNGTGGAVHIVFNGFTHLTDCK